MSEKIIIVEDDSGVWFFLKSLCWQGYRIKAFESYEEASSQ